MIFRKLLQFSIFAILLKVFEASLSEFIKFKQVEYENLPSTLKIKSALGS